jgi:phage protein D
MQYLTLAINSSFRILTNSSLIYHDLTAHNIDTVPETLSYRPKRENRKEDISIGERNLGKKKGSEEEKKRKTKEKSTNRRRDVANEKNKERRLMMEAVREGNKERTWTKVRHK